MAEFITPEITWVEAHHNQLIGLDSREASELVQSAGFESRIYEVATIGAIAANYVHGLVRLYSDGGVIVRVTAG